MTSYCSRRCRTASTPKEACQCSCDGENHGATATLGEFGTVAVEENGQHPRTNPFETVRIDSDASVSVERKTVTLADSDEYSLGDVAAGDRVDAFVEYADDGWQLHQKLDAEAVTADGVVVTKPDGFSTVIPERQIPAEQFRA